MAKARPIFPGHPPDGPEDPRPHPGNPRPDKRNKIFKKIGQEIIEEWKKSKGEKPLDRARLEAAIARHVRLDDDPSGRVEIGVIVDPKPETDSKFVWIVIPYPDAPEGTDPEKWIKMYEDDDELKTALGEAVLFGCGR